MRTKLLYLLVAMAVMTASCSDDDSWAPPLITDFAELATGGDGAIVSMTLDNGTKYGDTSAELKVQISDGGTLTPDTVYRAICIYTVLDKVATLRSYTKAFAPEPQSIEDFVGREIKTDPCTIQGIWRGGSYINARMLVEGKDQPHYVAFVDEGIAGEDYKELTIRLYHDQNNDPAAFTRTIYLSCPLRKYEGHLLSGRDSIAFVVNQQDKGITTYKLPY